MYLLRTLNKLANIGNYGILLFSGRNSPLRARACLYLIIIIRKAFIILLIGEGLLTVGPEPEYFEAR